MATQTWHHGLVARWWGEFLVAGDDIERFRRAIEEHGEPALDAGCGTGRLLVPFRRAGIDVDGADASADMLHWCEKRLAAAGLTAVLHRQAMHELNLPRRYRTIVVCGTFGLGGTRADDLEGLRRLHAHLEPGGTLVMDHYLPTAEPDRWSGWVEQPELPGAWRQIGERRRAADGDELELATRTLEFDPLEQTTRAEIRVAQFRAGEEIASETHDIVIGLYFKREIELMLRVAGFADVRVSGGLEDREARPWTDRRLLFEARRA